MAEIDPLSVGETDAATRDDLTVMMRFILKQYLRPETLRRLMAPVERRPAAMRPEAVANVDADPLAEIMAKALVEHLRQNGFVVSRRDRLWG
ncbi:MAG: hypothetical protein ABWY00_11575 [Dongiaceae bacterium]